MKEEKVRIYDENRIYSNKKMKTIVYLIRHSETLKIKNLIYNVSEEEQITNEKQPLSIYGEEKARKLSELKELENIDVLWTSHYVRAISTAKYIAFKNDININIDERFGERKIGITDKNGNNKDYWLIQLFDSKFKCNFGESQEEVRNRMYDGLKSVINENRGKRIVIVGHATAMTFLLMKWCKLINAELNGKIRCLHFNDKEVINDGFKVPEIFKLVFKDDDVIEIDRINYNF